MKTLFIISLSILSALSATAKEKPKNEKHLTDAQRAAFWQAAFEAGQAQSQAQVAQQTFAVANDKFFSARASAAEACGGTMPTLIDGKLDCPAATPAQSPKE